MGEQDRTNSNPDDGDLEQRAAPERLARPSVPAMEEILGQPFRLLDDGFVRVLDYMGGDAAVVQAARISYGTGTRRLSEDRGLIRFLMRHLHTTPFEMCEIKLHVRVPMDTWRQWIRHRTASVNEYSTRYSVAIDAAQRTTPGAWRSQSISNRQGSEGSVPLETGEKLSATEQEFQRQARAVYHERLTAGVAREQARKDLPLSTYTEAYWKIDLHNLLHFLGLRMHETAQEEIRSYAVVIGDQIVARWVPLVWEAFLDYRRHAIQLSQVEAKIVALLNSSRAEAALKFTEDMGLVLRRSDGGLVPNRERSELDAKLRALGLTPPWS
jgi:thymidylate synthase (FAD)